MKYTLHNKRRIPNSKFQILNSNQGIGLIEIIVGVSLITIALIGIVIAFTLYFRAARENTEKIQAAYLAEEGVEALLFLRGAGWSANIAPLATGTPYYLSFNNGWSVGTTEVVFDEVWIRSFVLDDVFRRVVDDDIIASTSPDANYLDLDAKGVTVTVRNASSTRETEVSTYLTNLFKN